MHFLYVIGYSVTHTLTLILLSSPILLLTSEAIGGESFDHLTSFPLQAFQNLCSKPFILSFLKSNSEKQDTFCSL